MVTSLALVPLPNRYKSGGGFATSAEGTGRGVAAAAAVPGAASAARRPQGPFATLVVTQQLQPLLHCLPRLRVPLTFILCSPDCSIPARGEPKGTLSAAVYSPGQGWEVGPRRPMVRPGNHSGLGRETGNEAGKEARLGLESGRC